MTEEQKYKKVNACESLEELANIIESFSDEHGFIQGKSMFFDAKKMAEKCRNYSLQNPNVLTRNYGIRQQAIYILFYESLKVK